MKAHTLRRHAKIAVVTSLLSTGAGSLFAHGRSPQEAQTREAVRALSAQVEAFRGAAGRLPTSVHELRAPPAGSALVSEIPRDAWGHELVLVTSRTGGVEKFHVVAPGPDGRLGTEDDVRG